MAVYVVAAVCWLLLAVVNLLDGRAGPWFSLIALGMSANAFGDALAASGDSQGGTLGIVAIATAACAVPALTTHMVERRARPGYLLLLVLAGAARDPRADRLAVHPYPGLARPVGAGAAPHRRPGHRQPRVAPRHARDRPRHPAGRSATDHRPAALGAHPGGRPAGRGRGPVRSAVRRPHLRRAVAAGRPVGGDRTDEPRPPSARGGPRPASSRPRAGVVVVDQDGTLREANEAVAPAEPAGRTGTGAGRSEGGRGRLDEATATDPSASPAGRHLEVVSHPLDMRAHRWGRAAPSTSCWSPTRPTP